MSLSRISSLIQLTDTLRSKHRALRHRRAMEDWHVEMCAYDEKRLNGTLTAMDTPPDRNRFRAEPRPINDPEFEVFWEAYDYKVGREAAHKAWKRMHPTERESARKQAPLYAAATPDKKYRKHPATWLNGRCWEDEIVDRTKRGPSEPPPPSPTLKPWLT